MKINWGVAIVISFIIFASLLAIAMIIGSNQRVDLVTPDYYQKELEFQDLIDQRENAKELGEIDFKVSSAEVSILFPAGLSAENCSGKIYFYKPDNANFDFTIDLVLNEENIAIVNREKRIGGLWKVMIHAEQNGKSYYWEDSIRL